MFGAIGVILFNCVSFNDVIDGLFADSIINPIKILLLFFSMTFLSIFLDEVGFFRFLANAALKHSGGGQIKLFLILYITVSVLPTLFAGIAYYCGVREFALFGIPRDR